MPLSLVAGASLASLVLATSAERLQQLSRRILSDDIVSRLGARCIGGSAAGYYRAAATSAVNATKYVIFLEGGGECRTADECRAWEQSHAVDSSQWPETRALETLSEMDSDCGENPDFCDWNKIYIPYCTGDMHAGTQTGPSATLGGYYFAGHNQIVGVVSDLRESSGAFPEPTHVLVTGSSAGGIGALMHTDYFGDEWPQATVKGAPRCGFFYAGVTALDDAQRGAQTPAAHLGFIQDWKPWYPRACANATGNNMSLCTDAHFLYPHLQRPVFIRENQFDTAKLANCGWNGQNATYLRAWGAWMRAQLDVIAHSDKDGFYSASCLEHGGNFGWRSSPVVNGVRMRDAVSNWFFDKGNRSMQNVVDTCAEAGGNGLPCTQVDTAAGQRCPHWEPPTPSGPLSKQCLAELNSDCPGLQGQGERCGACVRQHAADLKGHGCPQSYQPVYDQFCAGSVGFGTRANGAGHHVCDLSVSARLAVFGHI